MLSGLFFLFGVLVVAHVMFGYPLILRFLAKRRARPVLKGDRRATVSILLPVHNGAQFIREKLQSILRQDYPKELLQIIVLSDGSSDDTDHIVGEFEPRGVELMRLPRAGKPAALNAGFKRARHEILVLTDVRQELDPACIKNLVRSFNDPAVGVVSGEMLIRSGATHEEVDIGLYWRFESWVRKQLGRLDSTFGATGPIYAIRRELVVELPADILLDDVYLPLTAFFKGYRLVVDEAARVYDHPAKLGSEFRRKVRTLAGNYQIIKRMPQLLGWKNRLWFHFISYKLGRLLLPYALLLVAISSIFLPGGLAKFVVAGQIAFYSLAALDSWLPQGFIVKRISSPIRTFVVMMIAAVCALSVFFVHPKHLWKESTILPAAKSVAAGTDGG
jgi:biofilm PGA synthesis N-glycosyltransferase PgaC